jgi:hypothetical protein
MWTTSFLPGLVPDGRLIDQLEKDLQKIACIVDPGDPSLEGALSQQEDGPLRPSCGFP